MAALPALFDPSTSVWRDLLTALIGAALIVALFFRPFRNLPGSHVGVVLFAIALIVWSFSGLSKFEGGGLKLERAALDADQAKDLARALHSDVAILGNRDADQLRKMDARIVLLEATIQSLAKKTDPASAKGIAAAQAPARAGYVAAARRADAIRQKIAVGDQRWIDLSGRGPVDIGLGGPSESGITAADRSSTGMPPTEGNGEIPCCTSYAPSANDRRSLAVTPQNPKS